MTDDERALVIAEALTWERTPYHSNAAVKGAGADCALMPLAVYKAALPRLPKIPVPEYVQQWHLHRGDELYLEYVTALGGVMVDTPRPGDFALFKVARLYSHGAIVLEWPHVIHAVVGSGVIRGDITTEPRLVKAARYFFTL